MTVGVCEEHRDDVLAGAEASSFGLINIYQYDQGVRIASQVIHRPCRLPFGYVEKLCNVMSSRLTCCIVRGPPLVLPYHHHRRNFNPNDVSLYYSATFVGSRTSPPAR